MVQEYQTCSRQRNFSLLLRYMHGYCQYHLYPIASAAYITHINVTIQTVRQRIQPPDIYTEVEREHICIVMNIISVITVFPIELFVSSPKSVYHLYHTPTL